jgi:uncharacterized membrane protein YGL010W
MSKRTKAEWYRLYSESHQNRVNIVIHKICVPVIAITALGMFWQIPIPGAPGFVGLIVLGAALGFYLGIGGFQLLLKMLLLIGAPSILLWDWMARYHPEWGMPVAAGGFAVAWVGQFIGHSIEGKRPSFFQDLQFLLIGPAWVVEGRRAGEQ